MFDVSDWNDDSEAPSLPESLEKERTKETAAPKQAAVTSRKKRLKRTQELLEILRTLETPSNRETVHQLEPPTSPVAEIKCRRKEPDQVVPQSAEREDSGAAASDESSRLSRKQWRNKIKNKRRSKNKFKAAAETGPAATRQHDADQEPGAPTGAGGQGRDQEPGAPTGAGGQGRDQEPRAGEECAGLGAAKQAGKKRKRPLQKEPPRSGKEMEKPVMDDGAGKGHQINPTAPRGAPAVTAPRGAPAVAAPRGAPAVAAPRGAPAVTAPRGAPAVTAPRGAPAVTALERQRMQKLRKIMQECKSGKAQNSSDAPCETGKAEEEKEAAEEEKEAAEEEKEAAEADPVSPSKEDPPMDRSAALRSRMEQRLSAARFRYVNQQLYTSDSQEARSLFQSDPEAFAVYHSGFSQQVQRWPVNPVTDIIKYIKNRPPSLVVADFGCGDALIARSVRNEVHSFDLVALNEHVTVCDISKVPLADETVDVAVFCLSLMGTNFVEFLQEANRVLKMGGVLLVAEVSSRFDDVRDFLSGMSQLGFKNVSKNTESSHFFMFEFLKSGLSRNCNKHPGFALKPCLYKKR